MSKEVIYDENEDGWSYSFPSSLDNLQDTLLNSKTADEISIPSDEEDDKEKNHSEVPPVDIKEATIVLEVLEDSSVKDSVKVTKKNGHNGYRRLGKLNEKNGSYSSSTSSLAPSFLIKPSPAADPFLSRPPIQLQKYDDADFEEGSILEDEANSISPSIKTGTTLTSPATPKSKFSTESEKSVAREQLKSLNIDHPIPEESTNDNNGITATSPDMLSYRKSSRKKTVTSISSVDDVAPPSPNGTRTSTRDSFDRSLYADELYLDTRYRYATPERNTAFHDLFKSIPLDDRFLDDFSCALSREILIQGRIYVSERHICFNANILGWVTNLEIPHEDIISFEKKTTAGIFPNGIAINLKEDTRHSFVSFISRDSIFNFFETIWSKSVSKLQLENENSAVIPHVLTHYSRDMASEDQDRINNIILSIDTEDEEGENQQLQKVRVVRAKEKSEYKSDGPETHAPTLADVDLSKDTVLCEDILNAPIGLAFNILFGENIKFHQNLMEKSDGFDFTYYGNFSNNERSFEYQKRLGYSIGPKSTKCVVKESIEHFDYDSYIMVLTETKTPDVPSGGSFSVNTRYIFTWAKGNKTKLTLSYFINWTGSSWIKSMIQKSTSEGQKKFSELLSQQLKLVIAESTIVVAGDEEVPVTFSQEDVEEPKVVEPAFQSTETITETAASSGFDFWHVLIVLLIVLQILTYRELLATKQEMKLLALSMSTKK